MHYIIPEKIMSNVKFLDEIERIKNLDGFKNSNWQSINPNFVARMSLQNKFKTGLDIARYTADIMRKDMVDYDKDSSDYTQSLGCWHGFVAQQMMMGVKRTQNTTDKTYVYLSGWMVAALRSQFGPLPDQSMHEKTAVPALIKEIYTFLKRADSIQLQHLFNELDDLESSGKDTSDVMSRIDNFETHVVPIIADIDAGFGNEEATYLLARKMIEAGACAIQIENQVSDEKQCGHQDGKVTVPHEDFLAKINAVRYAFLELGVDNGIIVARTDSLGAGLTQKVPVSKTDGDLASKYNDFLETEPVNDVNDLDENDITIHQGGKLVRPIRLPNGLYRFKENTGFDRVVLDCVTSLQNGADLLWIETEKPNVEQIASMVNEIKKTIPNAKLVYNNSPSFNWTLAFRQQVFEEMEANGDDVSAYPNPKDDPKGLMDEKYDDTDLGKKADELISKFQADGSREAGIFHHLITLPTYHDLAGSTVGDTHKEYFSGENALKASGEANTMNQF
jgi:isocitrate lyase